MKIFFCSIVLAGLFAFLQSARADEYAGADAIIQSGLEQMLFAIVPPGVWPARNRETPEKLAAALEAFRKTGAALPPDEAAKRWLVLAERYMNLSPEAINSLDLGFGFDQVIRALPPPAAWPALAKAVEARPAQKGQGELHEIGLRLIAHRLVNDNDALNKDIGDLQALLDKGKGAGLDYPGSLPDNLRAELLAASDDGAAVLKQLEDSMAHPAAGEAQTITVPDLVSLVGEDKTADFLRGALRSNFAIDSVSGDETVKLARKLALEAVPQMRKPQWALAESIDATALFEAMQKRFPGETDGQEDANYPEAREYYMLGLIAANRTKDAAALAGKLESAETLPDEGLDALERAGFTDELTDFFYNLLSENPDRPYWGEYMDLAVKSGQQKKMLALIEASANRKGLPENQRLKLQSYLSRAYLAVDRVDEGVAILRDEIAAAKKASGVTMVEVGRHADSYTEENTDLSTMALNLAKLGALLGRKDLVDEGIQTAEDDLKVKRPADRAHDPVQNAMEIAKTLVELGRDPEAEAILKEALAGMPHNADTSQAQESLVLLMEIADRANRPADVLALLDHSPYWGAKDLADVLTANVIIDRNEDYAGYFAAKALAATGRAADARKILNALLDKESDYDPAYELLLKIVPHEEALARLDALYARDKYEPRPLIWKAKLLLEMKRLKEAEAAARQAVTIDPSDGEHGPGRRMLVYAVLADIREAQGDKKEAATYRGAVTAIRHSEDADKFYEAGLVTRAIQMYDESLTHFADAYCIQSRLALRMAELGDMKGAEEHYRRAYELMPDSFGRVESHCFGCEGAFAGPYAQNIAEQVFTDLAKKRPDKPQVHYLLGYLRKEEEDYRGALPEFREAVKLDPEYLNAWKMIADIAGDLRLPAAERDAVQLNLIRLDPLGRHSDFEPRNIINLAAGWKALESVSKLKPEEPGKLYPLKASAEELATLKKGGPVEVPSNEPDNRDPRSVVEQNQFIQIVEQLFSNGEMENLP